MVLIHCVLSKEWFKIAGFHFVPKKRDSRSLAKIIGYVLCVSLTATDSSYYDVWVIVLPALLLRSLSHLGTIAMNRCARFRISRLTMNIEYPWHDLCSSFLVPCCTFLTVHSVDTSHNIYVKYVIGTDKCMKWVKRKKKCSSFWMFEKNPNFKSKIYAYSVYSCDSLSIFANHTKYNFSCKE